MARLLTPVDAAWLVALRVGYGLALAISIWRFIVNGWVDTLFVRPTFAFKYWGFEWVRALPGDELHALFWGLLGLALCLAAGLAFRITCAAFTLGLIYIQLLDVTTYLNHYYLAALLGLLLSASPAGEHFSIDAWLRRKLGSVRRDASVATAWLYLFRFQVGVVYFFAGMAKLQSDWLLHAQPLRIWFGNSTGLPIIGPALTWSFVPLLLSWCGFLFDTTIVAFLSFKRTRPYAYAVVLVFHTLTRVLFPIGMFPVIMSLAALVFFSPSWPRFLLKKLGIASPEVPGASGSARAPSTSSRVLRNAALAAGGAWVALQLLLPLRSLAYGGNVLWHEQGMRFSWRVMVRAKGGGTMFVVHSPRTGKTYDVNPGQYLTRLQESEMSNQPDLILQLAHHVHDDFFARGFGDVEVRAESRAGLNGRRSAPLIDERVDLARVEDGLGRASFILPPPSEPPAHTRPVL
jgi:hypothetical protein